MKKLVLLIPVAGLFALAGALEAQEAVATPSPATTDNLSVPGAPPASATIDNPASLSLNPGAPAVGTPVSENTPTEEPKEQAKEPAATPRPTPASIPAPEGAKHIIPTDAPASDTELLTPTEDNGAATESLPPPDDTLPAAEPNSADMLNPDDTLVPPDVTESEPPPAPKIAENKYKEDRVLKVHYQEVKLQALKDVKVRSLHEQADAAKTDEGKRQALREYYRLLFAKMVKIDASLQAKCDEMEKAYLRRLGQYRVEPTIPLNPPPTPEPLEMAEASPTPKPKAKRSE
jgi:hypothetical protein